MTVSNDNGLSLIDIGNDNEVSPVDGKRGFVFLCLEMRILKQLKETIPIGTSQFKLYLRSALSLFSQQLMLLSVP